MGAGGVVLRSAIRRTMSPERHTKELHMRVLVIGANGNTATRAVRLLKAGRHDPVAMIRDPNQREKFDALGVPTVLADLEYPIDHAVRGVEAILFAAGSGGHTGKDKTVLVDQLGAVRSIVAAAAAGVRRYVMLSAMNADVQSESRIKHYHRAKAYADDFLRQTQDMLDAAMDYTIVRPGGLTDDPGTGGVELAERIERSGTISRDDVAHVLVRCLDLDNTVGKTFDILGGKTRIEDALAAV